MGEQPCRRAQLGEWLWAKAGASRWVWSALCGRQKRASRKLGTDRRMQKSRLVLDSDREQATRTLAVRGARAGSTRFLAMSGASSDYAKLRISVRGGTPASRPLREPGRPRRGLPLRPDRWQGRCKHASRHRLLIRCEAESCRDRSGLLGREHVSKDGRLVLSCSSMLGRERHGDCVQEGALLIVVVADHADLVV
jgi:hypothetical protein